MKRNTMTADEWAARIRLASPRSDVELDALYARQPCRDPKLGGHQYVRTGVARNGPLIERRMECQRDGCGVVRIDAFDRPGNKSTRYE